MFFQPDVSEEIVGLKSVTRPTDCVYSELVGRVTFHQPDVVKKLSG